MQVFLLDCRVYGKGLRLRVWHLGVGFAVYGFVWLLFGGCLLYIYIYIYIYIERERGVGFGHWGIHSYNKQPPGRE